MLAVSGPGTFGELDTAGARSVLRRYSDGYMNAARARRKGDAKSLPPPRRRFVPVRYYEGTFSMKGCRVASLCREDVPPILVRLRRDVPYRLEQVHSVTLVIGDGRLTSTLLAA